MADIISEIVAFFVQLLAPYTQIPQSTFMTVGMAVMVGLISATASKLLVNYDMVRNSMREFQQWRKDVDKARKANDEQGLSKLMKKQQAMTKLQARASSEQLKVTAVTFVPFLLLWYLMSAVFAARVVAVSPFWLPFIGDSAGPLNLHFIHWYFLSSFAINFPMMRLFGIGMSDN